MTITKDPEKINEMAKRSEICYESFSKIFNAGYIKARIQKAPFAVKKKSIDYKLFCWLISDKRIYSNIVSYTLMQKYMDYGEEQQLLQINVTHDDLINANVETHNFMAPNSKTNEPNKDILADVLNMVLINKKHKAPIVEIKKALVNYYMENTKLLYLALKYNINNYYKGAFAKKPDILKKMYKNLTKLLKKSISEALSQTLQDSWIKQISITKSTIQVHKRSKI